VVAGVTLRDLQGLEAISAEHRASRQSAAAVAAGLIEQEVIRFKERITGVDAEPVIRTLGERADALRQAEFDRASKRLQGLSPDQLQVVEALSRSLVSKLLADPIAYLRAEPEAADAVLDAFDLAPASDDESGRA
jgi:glutamyl-tRNA reductase